MVLIKWAFMVVLALLTSGGYMLIAGQLGMPIAHSLPLWLFGVFAIAAVGITSTSLIAVLGAGQADAGLSQALTMTAIGLAIGLLLGGIVTRIYDRRGYHRIPSGFEGMSPSGSAASTELTTEPAATTETTNTAE
jgi:hypothetical protein